MYQFHLGHHSLLSLFATALLGVTASSFRSSPTPKYNTKGSPKDGVLNVHLVPHSHDDVGWLKTVDQYFDGSHDEIQHACVKHTLDNVVSRLAEDPNRKFIEVEQAFFYIWWQQATEEQKTLIKQFLKNGQLEFIGGGWSMNDEAAVHFISTIDNMSVGHRFIAETFGPEFVPIIGWQIDPFGHSSWLASCFAESGFIGEFFARCNYGDESKRLGNKTMEMIWRGSNSKPGSTDLFTQKMYGGYGPNGEFFYENHDHDIIDDGSDKDNHLAKVDLFVSQALNQASYFQTNNILIPMGTDFTYNNNNTWFENMDKLVHYVNLDGRVNVLYSTPSIYTLSVNAQGSNVDWHSTLKVDDFFPYADNHHGYWSGYFTTRPNYKRMERRASNLMQAARQVEVATGGRVEEGKGNTLDNFERALGIAQHHDSITGNNKQAVAHDYSQRLSKGMDEAVNLMTERLSNLLLTSNDLCHCMLSNQTRCECTNDFTSDSMKVVIYNTLSNKRSEFVQVPLSISNIVVFDSVTDLPVKAQIVPVSAVTKALPAETADGLPNVASYVLHFEANLPAMGYSTYVIKAVKETSPKLENTFMSSFEDFDTSKDSVISSNIFDLTFAGGKLSSAKNTVTDKVISLNVEYSYYTGWCKDGQGDEGQHDGEYIFRPNEESAILLESVGTAQIVRGPIVTEIYQSYKMVNSVIRLYSDSDLIEVEHTVGSIDISDKLGKEIIVRYSTDIKSAGKMYTDSNGREMLERTRDFRPTWDLNLIDEPVARNYFPVNAVGTLKDASTQLTVLIDRSEGVASLADGEMEFMLHRRLMCDDSRGAGESLNEVYADGSGLNVRLSHFLAFSDIDSASKTQKRAQASIFAEPLIFYVGGATLSLEEANKFSLLASKLPEQLSLITLQSLKNNQVLLRLAHLFEAGEDSKLSKTVTVNVASLFPANLNLNIKSITETQLTGVKPKSSIRKLNWGYQAEKVVLDFDHMSHSSLKKKDVISLNPMEIKTFIVDLE